MLRPVQQLGDIGLDPCWNRSSRVAARLAYELPHQNGLELPWVSEISLLEVVFCNPGWADVMPWIAKASCEHQLDRRKKILLYTSFDPSVRWCGAAMDCASAFALWRRRVHHPHATAKGDRGDRPTAMFFWGPSVSMFRNAFVPYARVLHVG